MALKRRSSAENVIHNTAKRNADISAPYSTTAICAKADPLSGITNKLG